MNHAGFERVVVFTRQGNSNDPVGLCLAPPKENRKMQWTDVSRHWAAHIPRIMTQWPELDEDEVSAADGSREQFEKVLADRHDLTRTEAQVVIAEWLQGMEPADAIMDDTRDNERISASAADIPAGEDVYDDDAAFGDDDIPNTPIGKVSG